MISIPRLLITLAVVLSSALFALQPATASAAIKDDVCKGVGLSSGGSCDTSTNGSSSVNDIIKIGLNIFSAIIGIIAVVMFMVGGVKYMTSQGESGKINEAKNTILYAAVGLVVVAMAQILVRFVLTRFT